MIWLAGLESVWFSYGFLFFFWVGVFFLFPFPLTARPVLAFANGEGSFPRYYGPARLAVWLDT